MQLLELKVENFGVFEGRRSFDLRTPDIHLHKPILLFGGMNGSGKTTLFDGVKLSLYGRYVKGYRQGDSEYRQYLLERIHRRAGIAESENSSVSLEFEHVQLGQQSRYFVQRSWTVSGNGSEKMVVLKDGKPVDSVPPDQLQDFLIELIPLGLSKLFFFDGEQIQTLAQDDESNSHLAEAFNTLLGLEIIRRLETDLSIHLSRELRADEGKIVVELTRLGQEREAKSAEHDLRRRDRAQKQTEIDSVMAEIDRQERAIVVEGGGFASRRAELKVRKEALTKEIAIHEDHIRELASSLLPFAVVPDYCVRLKQTLIEEEGKQREMLGNEQVYKSISSVVKATENADFWRDIELPPELRSKVSQRFIAEMRATIDEVHAKSLVLLHQISSADARKILAWIDQALSWIPVELKNATLELETNIQEMAKVEESLSSIPPDETIAPLMRNLNTLHERLGRLQSEAAAIDELIRQVMFKLKEIDRLQAQRLTDQRDFEKDMEATRLANKVQDVLREFLTNTRKRKLGQVSTEFAETFNMLATKKNLVDRIEIEDNTFALTLFRKDGVVLQKSQLSAGEKQIYAIAMLTALARVSGRPLPFMIDTPLARLDSQHRENLIRNFFPNVSHQVLIFSTNTEIDKGYYEQLEPSIARAYLLSFDEKTESSSEYDGYFWKAARMVGK